MKKYYKINEIAKLYNIKTDSLRYYEEVGLICPMRSKSNYRLYTLNDIYILNIIRDCLKLGYDTHQIKEYLDNRSVNNTIVFLKEEEKLILRVEEEIDKLPIQRRKVLKLSVYQGMSYSQIAEVTGLSVNTVKTHMKKAYQELREKLYNEHQELFLLFIFSLLRED